MFQSDDIERLARLARVSVSSEEKEAFARDIETIVGYVSDITSAPEASQAPDVVLENVMREDTPTHEAGEYTESLMSAAPRASEGYVSVKKILP